MDDLSSASQHSSVSESDESCSDVDPTDIDIDPKKSTDIPAPDLDLLSDVDGESSLSSVQMSGHGFRTEIGDTCEDTYFNKLRVGIVFCLEGRCVWS